jgi:kynurenine formamidase
MTSEPTEKEVKASLFERNNWGRWGDADERGAINLITPGKRREALAAVRTAHTMSLSRPINTAAAPNNPEPAMHYMRFWHDGGEGPRNHQSDAEPGGWSADFYGVFYHGYATTHLDALSHVWDSAGLYNGRDPHQHVTTDGASFGGVQHWADGIVTRGVLVDIPRHRGVDYVTVDEPVHGQEIEEAIKVQGTSVSAGDALCVYMGREKWDLAHPDAPYGTEPEPRPGMHASCLPYIRDHDVSLVGWDMMDAQPWHYNVAWTVHGAIWAYGIALIDNMLLEDLADSCAERSAYDFMLVVAPLVVVGGTGSPVNPLAIL